MPDQTTACTWEPTTDDEFGPDLVIESGDEELWGRCGHCRTLLIGIRPDGSIDRDIWPAFEAHVMGRGGRR